MPRVFVSHSSTDSVLAAVIVERVLRDGLGLCDADIRFSANAPTGLGITRDWLESLRVDIQNCEVLLAVVTEAFLASAMCNAEVGAGWALEKELLPISAVGLDNQALGPVLRSCNVFATGQVPEATRRLATVLACPEPSPGTLRDVALGVGEALGATPASPLLKRGEVLPEEKLLDAALMDETVEVAYYRGNFMQETMVLSKDERHILPTRLVWGNPYGPSRWLELCDDPLYYHGASVRFLRDTLPTLIGTLRDAHPRCMEGLPDVVSLGCGDGRKDMLLLRALTRQGEGDAYSPFYYPFDAHDRFIRQARELIRSDESLGTFRMKAVIGDFYCVDNLLPIVDYRAGPNLFLLLGNTLGTQQTDLDLLVRIGDAMNPQDALVLEVRLARAGAALKAGGADQRRRRFNFGPLEAIGVQYDEALLDYHEAQGMSQIPRTRTLRGVYGPYRALRDQRSGRELRTALCCIHHYDLASLREAVESKGFEVLTNGDADCFRSPDESFGLMLLRRTPHRPRGNGALGGA